VIHVIVRLGGIRDRAAFGMGYSVVDAGTSNVVPENRRSTVFGDFFVAVEQIRRRSIPGNGFGRSSA